MRRVLTASALFTALFAGAVLAQDADKALKELEGDYSLKSLSKGGKAAPDEVIADFKGMVIKDGTITIKLKDRDQVAKLKLDPAKKPAHIDITPTEGPKKDMSMKGIYKFEKGTLTIVISEGDERPKDFKATGDEQGVIVFQKKKGD